MQKIWVSGAKGQIGKAINDAVDKLEYEMLDTDISDVDITDIDEVLRFGEINRPDVIINCSALTDINECENDPRKAYKVNALGARNLSIVAQKLQAKMVQISTDDVFDGEGRTPYTEYDKTNPKTVYGRSKEAGENYVKEFANKHFIIRSTWVYGKGSNFVTKFLNKVETGEPLSIANDQLGSPTSAMDLAEFILELIHSNEYGTYHATNRGVCSRYEFAQEILRITGKQAELKPVLTDQSDFSSVRPPFVVLDNFVLSMIKIHEFPLWQDSLAEYLKKEKI